MACKKGCDKPARFLCQRQARIEINSLDIYAERKSCNRKAFENIKRGVACRHTKNDGFNMKGLREMELAFSLL